MRNSKIPLIAGCIALAAAVPPVQAQDDNTSAAAAAALVLLGAAALAHHEDHHTDGKHLTQTQEIAAFDRGYSDGLHNEAYNSRGQGSSYADGYAAGHKERENRLAASRNNHATNGTPSLAMRACVGEASANWNRNPRDIYIVNSRKDTPNQFLVEVAAGHRHGSCAVGPEGKIHRFKDGRI